MSWTSRGDVSIDEASVENSDDWFADIETTSLKLYSAGGVLAKIMNGEAEIKAASIRQTVSGQEKIKLLIPASAGVSDSANLKIYLAVDGRDVAAAYDIAADGERPDSVFWLTLKAPELRAFDISEGKAVFTLVDNGVKYSASTSDSPDEGFVVPGQEAWQSNAEAREDALITVETSLGDMGLGTKVIYFKLYTSDE